MSNIFGIDDFDQQLTQAEAAAGIDTSHVRPGALCPAEDFSSMQLIYGAPADRRDPVPAVPSMTLSDQAEILLRTMYLMLTRRPLQGGPPLSPQEQGWCHATGDLLSQILAQKKHTFR